MKFKTAGFTLVELIIVIGIIGILSIGVLTILDPFSQFEKANDARRIQDLSQIQKALEIYYYDNGSYPVSTSIYTIQSQSGTSLTWGSSWQPYMNVLPQDPNSADKYVYYSPPSFLGQIYYLYASLGRGAEEPEACQNLDTNGECPTVDSFRITKFSCGGPCNFEVSSPNVSQTAAQTAPTAIPTSTPTSVPTSTPTSVPTSTPTVTPAVPTSTPIPTITPTPSCTNIGNLATDADHDGYYVSGSVGSQCTTNSTTINGRTYYSINNGADGYPYLSRSQAMSNTQFDCCDSDANAYPGEPNYYSTPDNCGNYDYDCSGSGTVLWSIGTLTGTVYAVQSAKANGGSCISDPGFESNTYTSTVAACGVASSGYLIDGQSTQWPGNWYSGSSCTGITYPVTSFNHASSFGIVQECK